MSKFLKASLFFGIAGFFLFLAAGTVSAMVITGSYMNTAKRADWTKYGLNPWSWDTDQDGYGDAQEIKNNFCPTSPDFGVILKSADCQKGKFNLSKKSYTPPVGLAVRLPQDLKKFPSCAALAATAQKRFDAVYGDNRSLSVLLGLASSTDYYSDSFYQIHEADLVGAKADVKTAAGAAYGDILKTDGRYLYTFGYKILGENAKDLLAMNMNLSVVKLDARGSAALAGQVDLPVGPDYKKIFLSGRYLAVVGITEWGKSGDKFSEINTYVAFYDVKNPARPVFLRNFVFSGNLEGAVLGADGYLYVVSGFNERYLAAGSTIQKNYHLTTSSKSAPLMFESSRVFESKNLPVGKSAVACGAINYFENDKSLNFLTISGVKMNGSAGVKNTVLFGGVEFGYLTPTNLYLAVARKNYHNDDLNNTSFYRWNFMGGKATLAAAQIVPGDVGGGRVEISPDSKHLLVLSGGYARTAKAEKNDFYILDSQSLSRVGWLENFYFDGALSGLAAADKRVYAMDSMRGKLAAIDISNPKKPRFAGIGQLPYTAYGLQSKLFTLPGNQFLSFGNIKDNAATNTLSAATALSLWPSPLQFDWIDASDPTFLQNIGKRNLGSGATILPGVLTDNDLVVWDHKNNLVAFSLMLTTSRSNVSLLSEIDFNGLMVYRLNNKDKKLEFVGNVARASAGGVDNSLTTGINSIKRAFFSGGYLYVLSFGNLTVHNVSDLSMTASAPISDAAAFIKVFGILQSALATVFSSSTAFTTSSFSAN